MKIYRDLNFTSCPRAVALGFFDGLHRGHQLLLHTLLERAAAGSWTSLLLSFDRQPLSYLNDQPEMRLAVGETAWAQLEDFALDELALLPVGEDILNLSAERFFQEILVDRLQARCLIVGADYRFGRGAEGRVSDLKRWTAECGMDLQVLPDLQCEGRRISSTWIREALQAGQCELAHELLGRPFAISGAVQSGQQLGRKLGFPTLNLAWPEGQLLPRLGVYAACLHWQGRAYQALLNIGRRPTVNHDESVLAEAYVFDFQAELYDETVQIDCLSFIRDEQKFSSIAELKKQIAQDKEKVLRFFAKEKPEIQLRCGEVEIWLNQTERFAGGRLDLELTLPFQDETATEQILLARLLLSEQAAYPDPSALAAALEEHYNCDLSLDYSRRGRTQVISWSLEGLQLTPGGEDALLAAVDILEGALLAPRRTEAGHWPSLQREKDNLRLELQARDEDKLSVAFRRLRASLGIGDCLALAASGSPERLDLIHQAELAAAYRSLLQEASVHLIWTGRTSPTVEARLLRFADHWERIAASLNSDSGPLKRRKLLTNLAHGRRIWQPRPDLTEKRSGAQEVLLMAFQGLHAPWDPHRLLDRLFFNVWVNDSHAVLFQRLREQEGLCYNLFAQCEAADGLAYLCVELKPGQMERVRCLILESLQRLAAGEIKPDELQQSQALLREQIVAGADRPLAFAAASWQRLQTGFPPRARQEDLARLQAYTVADLAETAARLDLLQTYSLITGEED